jgi:iron(III) transport system ATP-binding protein
MSQLSIEDVTVRFGRGAEAVVALDSLSLDVAQGELVVLLGPSGCGKSTALNCVAGLVEPTSGTITIADHTVFQGPERFVNLPPDKRHLGMVFQSYSLWPHMTVRANVEFPLKARRTAKEDRGRRVDEALARVQVGELAHRYPGELSGGQQQRVAVARAIVAENDLLLFDEPLSNLDTRLRQELRDEIRALHQRLGFTGLYVTHDQVEALTLATTVVVMRRGGIEQMGSPEEIYAAPASTYVARFLGANTLSGTARPTEGGTAIVTAFGTFEVPEAHAAGPVVASFFPQHGSVRPAADGPAVVALDKFAGRYREVIVTAGGERVEVSMTSSQALEPGQPVHLDVDSSHLFVYAAGADDVHDVLDELEVAESVVGAVGP